MTKEIQSGVFNDGYLKWLAKEGVALPAFANHGSSEDIRDRLKPMRPKKWELRGNMLTGHTEDGEVTINVGTNMILMSSEPDTNGLPQLKKLDI